MGDLHAIVSLNAGGACADFNRRLLRDGSRVRGSLPPLSFSQSGTRAKGSLANQRPESLKCNKSLAFCWRDIVGGSCSFLFFFSIFQAAPPTHMFLSSSVTAKAGSVCEAGSDQRHALINVNSHSVKENPAGLGVGDLPGSSSWQAAHNRNFRPLHHHGTRTA